MLALDVCVGLRHPALLQKPVQLINYLFTDSLYMPVSQGLDEYGSRLTACY
jgi:hypothetical protein